MSVTGSKNAIATNASVKEANSVSGENFGAELLALLKEIRNELRIMRYAKQAALRGAKLDALCNSMAHDVEVDRYDRSIETSA
jgi:hypothetical protein